MLTSILPHAPEGYEHVEALGGTIESIAAAKAGIMKSGRPVVVARQEHAAALGVLRDTASRLGCGLIMADEQVGCGGYEVIDKGCRCVCVCCIQSLWHAPAHKRV